MSYIKSKIVMLPTEKAGRIVLDKKDNTVFYDPLSDTTTKGSERFSNQYLYFLSDEEIKEGDWIYRNVGTKSIIQQCNKESVNSIAIKEWKKIIASTDPQLNQKWEERKGERFAGFITDLPKPSDKFLQKYCEKDGIDEVMVEYEEYHGLNTTLNEICYYSQKEEERANCHWKDPYPKDYRLKITSDNTITIKPIKPIKDSWNREEMIDKIKEVVIDYERNKIDFTSQYPQWISKWLEQNL